MDILILFIGICIYVMIGGFLAAILGWSDDLPEAMTLFWPIIVPIMIIISLARLSIWIGELLVDLFRIVTEFIKEKHK